MMARPKVHILLVLVITKANRALYLWVPNLEDDINMPNNTAQSIVENISKELIGNKDNKLFHEIISRAYKECKDFLF